MSEKMIEVEKKKGQEAPVVELLNTEYCSTAEFDLLLLFDCCMSAYEFMYSEDAGLVDALRGGFSLMLQERFRRAWDEVCEMEKERKNGSR